MGLQVFAFQNGEVIVWDNFGQSSGVAGGGTSVERFYPGWELRVSPWDAAFVWNNAAAASGTTTSGVGSASGVGAATGTGRATAAAVYSSTGTGTATAVGHDANAVALKNMLFSFDYRFETYSLVSRQQQYALGNRSMLFNLLS